MTTARALARRVAPPAAGTTGRGIAYMVSAVLVFSASNALVKWSAATYPVVEVTFFRNAFALIPAAWLVWANGGIALLRTNHPGSHLYRGCVGVSTMVLVFYGFSVMPLADATALSFASPIVLTALSVPLLGEKVGIYRWSAVVVGFVGVLIIARPGYHLFNLGAMAVFGSTITYALAMISVRQMSRTEHPVTITVYFAVVGTIAMAVPLLFLWRTPDLPGLGILISIGLLGGLGQYFQTQAFRLAPAAVARRSTISASCSPACSAIWSGAKCRVRSCCSAARS